MWNVVLKILSLLYSQHQKKFIAIFLMIIKIIRTKNMYFDPSRKSCNFTSPRIRIRHILLQFNNFSFTSYLWKNLKKDIFDKSVFYFFSNHIAGSKCHNILMRRLFSLSIWCIDKKKTHQQLCIESRMQAKEHRVHGTKCCITLRWRT